MQFTKKTIIYIICLYPSKPMEKTQMQTFPMLAEKEKWKTGKLLNLNPNCIPIKIQWSVSMPENTWILVRKFLSVIEIFEV